MRKKIVKIRWANVFLAVTFLMVMVAFTYTPSAPWEGVSAIEAEANYHATKSVEYVKKLEVERAKNAHYRQQP